MDLFARIHRQYHALVMGLPKVEKKHLFLTGGAAAFLYGSQRPFSEDLDFMVPERFRAATAKRTGLRFKINKKKPIFHSLLASFKVEGITCSVILESVVQPRGSKHSFVFVLDPSVEARQVKIRYQKDIIRLVPPEFLFLIKLLAGRGKSLKKYDLYDARQILLKTKKFNLNFFKQLILKFCQPLSASKPLLQQHLHSIRQGHPKLTRLVSVLKSLE